MRANKFIITLKYPSVATIMLLVVSFFWGFTFTITKNVLNYLDPYYFVGIRYLISAFTLVFFIKDWKIFLNKEFLKAAGLLGIFNFLTLMFQTLSLQFTLVTNSAFIATSYVLIVPLLGFLLFRQKITKNIILAVVVGLMGMILLLSCDLSKINIGDLLSFGCALAYSLHILYTGKATEKFPVLQLTFFQIAMVSILSFLCTPMGEHKLIINSDVIITLVFTAVVCTTFAFLMQTMLQKVVKPTTTAIIFSTEPVFATLTAVVIGHEVLVAGQYAGCSFMVLAVLISQWKIK